MLFDFPLQQWFDERPLVLGYAYIAFKLRSRDCVSAVFFLSLCVGKGKAVPLQAWSGPEGSRKLRHRMVVRLSALRTGRLYPQETLPVLISVRG